MRYDISNKQFDLLTKTISYCYQMKQHCSLLSNVSKIFEDDDFDDQQYEDYFRH